MGSDERPRRLRFDPCRLAALECAAWVAYYQRRWLRLLAAAVGLLRAELGMSWPRTVRAAWYALRAIQLWAPIPGNDPDGARRHMHRFYALVKATYGRPKDPAESARLEVEWWRVHRAAQQGGPSARSELVQALVRLYASVFGVAEAAVRPAAVHRCRAMEISDQWVALGRHRDSNLLALERAALVQSYTALYFGTFGPNDTSRDLARVKPSGGTAHRARERATGAPCPGHRGQRSPSASGVGVAPGGNMWAEQGSAGRSSPSRQRVR